MAFLMNNAGNILTNRKLSEQKHKFKVAMDSPMVVYIFMKLKAILIVQLSFKIFLLIQYLFQHTMSNETVALLS